jgi:hypothetical protein
MHDLAKKGGAAVAVAGNRAQEGVVDGMGFAEVTALRNNKLHRIEAGKDVEIRGLRR